MALIDVTELLNDPDFVDSLGHIRRTQTVGTNGRASFTETDMGTILGSVQSGADGVLERVPDAARPSGWIRVYTTAQLVAHDEGAGVYGDVLVWSGRRWQVRTTDDWSNFGAGYVKAFAELIPQGAP